MSAGILLTGATGYIGGRLLRRLEEGGRAVRCLARQPARLGATGPATEVVQGDCLDEPSLDRALAGVHSAYYLVDSMGGGSDFAEVDRRAADNFGRAAARAGVRRIIYLGGLTGEAGSLSTHLRSRAETGDVLRASGVPVIEFRASIVIGAGSLSFQMIQALVERLPVMICPRWVATLTQPIAIEDVLACDPENCAPKDVIDGWTVEAFEPDRRLRLSADLRLPGRGWLEFEVTPLDNGRRSLIRQTATFGPRGVLGQAYWYAILPIHGLMFRGMLRGIVRQVPS